MTRYLQLLIFSTLIAIGSFVFILAPQTSLAEVDCFLNPGDPACPPPIIPQCNTLDVTFRGTPIYKVTRICTVCDFFELVQRVINFIYIMTWPAATLMLIYGGFLMIIPTAGGEKTVQQFNKGKKVLTNTIVGIVIVFLAWIFIDTIIKVGANQSVQQGGIGKLFINQKPLPWNEIKCVASFPGQTPPSVPPPPVGQLGSIWYCKRGGVCACSVGNPDNPTPGSDFFGCGAVGAQTCSILGPMQCPVGTVLAELIRVEGPGGIIRIDGNGDCRDTSGALVSARTTYVELVQRQPLTVCNSTCKSGSPPCSKRPGVTINENLMRMLVALTLVRPFTVISLTTGQHSATSLHYTGNAVDLAPSSLGRSMFINFQSFFLDSENRRRFNITGFLCETREGGRYNNCNDAPVTETINHVHIELGR